MGVSYDASDTIIREARKKLSLLVHPDKCSHPRAEDAFRVLNEAYVVLSNQVGFSFVFFFCIPGRIF